MCSWLFALSDPADRLLL